MRGPKSICQCGHSGDGPDSDHATDKGMMNLAPGHSRCTVPGCDCQRFTWAGFSPEYEKQLVATRKTS